jgi:hypothetical protein
VLVCIDNVMLLSAALEQYSRKLKSHLTHAKKTFYCNTGKVYVKVMQRLLKSSSTSFISLLSAWMSREIVVYSYLEEFFSFFREYIEIILWNCFLWVWHVSNLLFCYGWRWQWNSFTGDFIEMRLLKILKSHGDS